MPEPTDEWRDCICIACGGDCPEPAEPDGECCLSCTHGHHPIADGE